jgi:hypothetical protein
MYLFLSFIAGIIIFIYDTIFNSYRSEWPTIFLALGLPFSIIRYNTIGILLSFVLFEKKWHITISYIIFFINYCFSLSQMNFTYNLAKNIEILKRLNNYDMASLNHNSNFIFSNIISFFLIIGLFFVIKIIRKNYFKRLIKLNDELFKKKILNFDKMDLELFLDNLKDDDLKKKYEFRIKQLSEKD